MSDDTILPFGFPAVDRKKLIAGFNGGRITSDGGVLLLGAVERRLGIATKLARLIADPRNPALVTHSVDDILRARILAIACGYEDADDLAHLRTDPAFKLACHRLPDSGGDLCSQPTVSRWENAPGRREVVRMTYALIDLSCASFARPPAAVTLDLDDTPDIVHGHQELSLFNSHYGERCFLPIHVYDTATGRPVAVLLRPGKTPSGAEIRGHLRRLVRRIRQHWPDTRLTMRGDSHYGRPEGMAWCEANGLDYIFGLSGNAVLDRLVEPIADAVRVRRALTQAPTLRRGSADWLYAAMYCARGAAENLIKLHKGPLASDRTSCREPLANQVRLILHTAAYWLLLSVRDAIPRPQPLATAEFPTLRLRLIKIGARIIETATRVRIAFTAACPEAALFASLVRGCLPAGP